MDHEATSDAAADTPPDEWDDYASTWDDDAAARAYASAALASLRAALVERQGTLDGAVVCDFGCGTGLLTEQIVPMARHIDAIDTSSAMLEVLRAKIDHAGWTHVRTHAEVPDRAAGYDLIVCSSVCSFLDDHPGMVAQLGRRLAPGGVFVQWDWERDPADAAPHGLTRAEIREALVAAGLAAVTVETGFTVSVDGTSMSPLMGIAERPG